MIDNQILKELIMTYFLNRIKMKFKMPKFKNLKLSRPALIALIAYFIMALIILLPFDISKTMPEEEKYKYDVKRRFKILLLLLIPIALSVYSVDCMIKGNCWTWSYIQAILIALYVILFSVVTLQNR